MAIIHIVLFEWKSTATQDQISQACKQMLALGENCLHATSRKPYVKSMSGGLNNSPEGHAVLLTQLWNSAIIDTCKAPHTHGFVVEFENEEDRDYYLNKDPAHLSFVKDNGPMMNSVKVLDFEPGKF